MGPIGKMISREDLGKAPTKSGTGYICDAGVFLEFAGHEEADLNSEAKSLYRLCDSIVMGKFLYLHSLYIYIYNFSLCGAARPSLRERKRVRTKREKERERGGRPKTG